METMLIINQKAAKGIGLFSLDKILSAFQDAGIETETATTTHPKHAIELAEKAVKDGAKRVIVSGGDGSVNEVVNGLVLAQIHGYGKASLGIIPNGRGNDFCYCLNIPKKLSKAAAIIAAGNQITTDVGVAGDGTFDRYFINGSGFGVDSAINYHASNSFLNGFPSYAWGVVHSIFTDMDQVSAQIEIDGEHFENKLLLFTAMNGMREGGGFTLAPQFSLQDGLLDLCWVGDGLPWSKILPLLPRLFSGNLDHPYIHKRKARQISIHTEGKGLFSQVDGETIITRGHDFRSAISDYKIDLIVPKAAAEKQRE